MSDPVDGTGRAKGGGAGAPAPRRRLPLRGLRILPARRRGGRESLAGPGGGARSRSEAEFLPAAVEALERPASPAGRWLALTICALAVGVVAWGWLGRIDTVAVAHGKLVAGGRAKAVQPLELATVRAIHVRDGQSVAEGEVLVELDATAPAADRARLAHDLAAQRLDAARYAALAESPLDPLAAFAAPAGADPALAAAARAALLAEAAEHRAALAALDAEIRQREAEARTIEATAAAYRDSLPPIRRRHEALRTLAEQGHASDLRLAEIEERLILRERSLEAERRRAAETREAIAALEHRKRAREAALAARAGAGLTEALRRTARLEQDLAKARQRESDRTLRAPVAGTVHDVAVNTIGGVVAPAQRLMSVVPADAPLEVDAALLNKDAGFVRPGQRAAVKIESFPFTRYGLVPGEVTRVSADAVDDPALGLVYPLRASLAENRILAGDRWVPLAPGMAAAVEVATGKRRAIDFFLSPLRRYTDEALRER